MSMKIRPVGAELFHADGQKDRDDEANSNFSQFFERVYKGRTKQQSPQSFYNACLLLAT